MTTNNSTRVKAVRNLMWLARFMEFVLLAKEKELDRDDAGSSLAVIFLQDIGQIKTITILQNFLF